MLSTFIKPNIMVLQGVRIEHLQEDDKLFENRILEEAEISNSESFSMPLIPLPRVFKDRDNWIKNTNLLCINCSRKIKNVIPIPIPKSIFEDTDGQTAIGIEDCCCCSFNCVRRYIDKEYTGIAKEESLKYLDVLFEKMVGTTIKIILPSENKKVMDMYCGNGISSEQYGKKLLCLDRNFKIIKWR